MLHFRIRIPAYLGCLAIIVASLAFADRPASAALTRPLRGTFDVPVLLCKNKDTSLPSTSLASVHELFDGTAKDDVGMFYMSQSHGLFKLNPLVHGWYTTQDTLATDQANANPPGRGPDAAHCVSAAESSKTDPFTPGSPTVIIYDPHFDLYGNPKTVMTYDTYEIGARLHEFGHGLDLDHTRSWNTNAEYDDPYDVMSYGFNYDWHFTNGNPNNDTTAWHFVTTGLSAFELDRFGWLGMNQSITAGADGRTSGSYDIYPVEGSAPGLHAVRVPMDPADPGHYISVEYHQKTGYDQYIPASTVILNDIKYFAPNGRHDEFMMYANEANHTPLTQYAGSGVSIASSIEGDHAHVTVTIAASLVATAKKNFGAMTCREGYEWRQIDGFDYVCVAPGVRARASSDDSSAATRALGAPGSRCKQGYVWREAFPGDDVCTTSDQRAQASADNAQRGARLAY